jgi:hypothetical protein
LGAGIGNNQCGNRITKLLFPGRGDLDLPNVAGICAGGYNTGTISEDALSSSLFTHTISIASIATVMLKKIGDKG